MLVFGFYNIVVSIILIVLSIVFIKQINEDIKKDEEYKKINNVEWIDKYIKSYKRYKVLNYIVLVFSVLVILFTLFIFITKFTEVL